jgi:hypothetical protein
MSLSNIQFQLGENFSKKFRDHCGNTEYNQSPPIFPAAEDLLLSCIPNRSIVNPCIYQVRTLSLLLSYISGRDQLVYACKIEPHDHKH